MPRKKKETNPSAFAAKVLSLAGQPTEDTPGIVPVLERAARKGVESEGSVGCRTGHETEPDPEPSVTQSPQAEPDGSGFGPFTLEAMVMADWGARIDTATPCQRAICRTLEGRPIGELAEDPYVRAMFGGVIPELTGTPPEVAMILSGIRAAKSTVIACTAIHRTQTIELPDWIRPSDELRIPIVSTDVDTATATFSHVRDTILSSPRLMALLARDEKGNPIEPKAGSLLLRHPSGRKDIEIRVVALSRAGATLSARWFVSAIFDEAPKMGGEVDFVRSFDEAYRNCIGRVLKGGTIMLAGSPHARIGPIYDMFREHFAKPTAELVIAKARGDWLNPYHWTPENCAKMQRKDRIAYQTDVACEFKDPESALGDSASIEAAMKVEGVKPIKGHHYVAAMDPATRVNAWTLVVVECYGHKGTVPAYRVALAKQWTPEPGRTLSPTTVFNEIAADLSAFGLTECYSDIAGTDFAVELAAQSGIELIQESPDLLELGREMMALIRRELLDLPKNDNQLREDLQSVRARTSSNGNVTPVLPKSTGGRHCDYFPSMCLTVKHLPEPPDETVETTMQQRDLEREIADFASRNDDTDGARASRKASGW